MGGLNKKKILAAFLVVGVVVNLLPHLMNMVFALEKENLIKNIQLVSTKDDPRDLYTIVKSTDTYNQLVNKYYVKIDWDGSNIIGKIQPGDKFTVKVEGLLLENSVNGYDIRPTNTTDPSTVLPIIGKITVQDNIITALFNDNVGIAPVSTLSDLGGSIFVRTTIDVNKFIGNTTFSTSFYAGSTLRTKLDLLHADLTPTLSVLRKFSYENDSQYRAVVDDALPGETVTSKLTINPKEGYTIVKYMLAYYFNDYCLDYFSRGLGNGTPQDSHPIFNGDNAFNYTFERQETTPRRPDNMTSGEALSIQSQWIFDPLSPPEFSTPATLVYDYFLNPNYIDNDYQVYRFNERIDIDALYKVLKIDEIYNESHAGGRTDTTFVTVKFLYDDGSTVIEVLPNREYPDVSLNNSQFSNYVLESQDASSLQSKGYSVLRIDSLNMLDKDGTKNIVYVYCKKDKPTPPTTPTSSPTKTTSVTIKYIYQNGSTSTQVIADKVVNQVPLDNTTYLNYEPDSTEKLAIQNAGYLYSRTASLQNLDTDGSKNIIYVYCIKKTDPKTTYVTIKYIYQDGSTSTQIIADKVVDRVALNDTTYSNYEPDSDEKLAIKNAGYLYSHTVPLQDLNPDGSKNIIYVYCTKDPNAKTTSVTVKYLYVEGSKPYEIIPDKVIDKVLMSDKTYFSYEPGDAEKLAIRNAGYVYNRTVSLKQLDLDGSKNIIYVYCTKGTDPIPTPTTTTTNSTRPTSPTTTSTRSTHSTDNGGSIYVPTTSASVTPSSSPTPSTTVTNSPTGTTTPWVPTTTTATTTATTTSTTGATPTELESPSNPYGNVSTTPSLTPSPSPSGEEGKINPDTADNNFIKFGTVMIGGCALAVLNRKKMTTKNK